MASATIENGCWVRLLAGEHKGRKGLVAGVCANDFEVEVLVIRSTAPWHIPDRFRTSIAQDQVRPCGAGASSRIFFHFPGNRHLPPRPRAGPTSRRRSLLRW